MKSGNRRYASLSGDCKWGQSSTRRVMAGLFCPACTHHGRFALGTIAFYTAAIFCADLRCFSVADFSCPQAAMMSSPRGVRIGLA